MEKRYLFFIRLVISNILFFFSGLIVNTLFIIYAVINENHFLLSFIILLGINVFLIVITFVISYFIVKNNLDNSFTTNSVLYNNSVSNFIIISILILISLVVLLIIHSSFTYINFFISLYLFHLLITDLSFILPETKDEKTIIKDDNIEKDKIEKIIEQIKKDKDYHGEIIFERWIDEKEVISSTEDINSKYSENLRSLYELFNEEILNSLYPHQMDLIYKMMKPEKDILFTTPDGSGKTLVLQLAICLNAIYKQNKSIVIIPDKSFEIYIESFEENIKKQFYSTIIQKIINYRTIDNIEEDFEDYIVNNIIFIPSSLIFKLTCNPTKLKNFIINLNFHLIICEDLEKLSIEHQTSLKVFLNIIRAYNDLIGYDNMLIISSSEIDNDNNVGELYFKNSEYDRIQFDGTPKGNHKLIIWQPSLIRKNPEDLNDTSLIRKGFISDAISLAGKFYTLLNNKILLFSPSSLLSSRKIDNIKNKIITEMRSNKNDENLKIDMSKINITHNISKIKNWETLDAIIMFGEYKDLVRHYDEVRSNLSNYSIIIYILSPEMLTSYFIHTCTKDIDNNFAFLQKKVMPILYFSDKYNEITNKLYIYSAECLIRILDDTTLISLDELKKINVFGEEDYLRSLIEKYFSSDQINGRSIYWRGKCNSFTNKNPFENDYYEILSVAANTVLGQVHSDIINKIFIKENIFYIANELYRIDAIDVDKKEINCNPTTIADQGYFDSMILKEALIESIGSEENNEFTANENNKSIQLKMETCSISEKSKKIVYLNESLLQKDFVYINSDSHIHWKGWVIHINVIEQNSNIIKSLQNIIKLFLQVKINDFNRYFYIGSDDKGIFLYSYLEKNSRIIHSIYDYLKDQYKVILKEVYNILRLCHCEDGCESCIYSYKSFGENINYGKIELLKFLGDFFGETLYVNRRIENLKNVEKLEILAELRDSVLKDFIQIFNNNLIINNVAKISFFSNENSESKFAGLCYGNSSVEMKKGMSELTTLSVISHEYAHNWQSDGNMASELRSNDIPYNGKLFVEGFAMWVEYHYLSYYQFKQRMESADMRQYDEYGEGLDFFLFIENKYGFQFVFDFITAKIESSWKDLLKESGIWLKIQQKEKEKKDWTTDIFDSKEN